MLLLSWTTVRLLKTIIGLIPLVVGGILVYAGLGDPTTPTNLVLLGIGGILLVTGGYQAMTAIFGQGSPT